MEREPRLDEVRIVSGVGSEGVGAQRTASAQHPFLDQPLHRSLGEARLTEPSACAAAVVVGGDIAADLRSPEAVAPCPEQDRGLLRQPTVSVLPRFQIGHRDVVVSVLLNLVSDVDDDRRKDEISGVELFRAQPLNVEVARRAVVRAGVLALLHVLEVEAVGRHREDRREAESGVAGEH